MQLVPLRSGHSDDAQLFMLGISDELDMLIANEVGPLH
jgi:hypothetical protein